MEVIDKAVWEKWKDKNKNEYGKMIIDYAERWADLMEIEIAKGKAFSDFAKDCSHKANTDGISGFMFEAAVWTLATCWKYGKQLSQWQHELEGEG